MNFTRTVFASALVTLAFASACGGTRQRIDRGSRLPRRAPPETLAVRIGYHAGQTDSVLYVTDTIVTGLVYEGSEDPGRPVSLPESLSWRPLRHFGPFRQGSDLEQIQVLVNGVGANWFFNGYFASFTPAEIADAEPIYRIYYRNNLFADDPTTITLPTTPTVSLTHVPGGARPAAGPSSLSALQAQYPYGFAINMLFSLSSVAWSSRYGGTVLLTFGQAFFQGQNQPAGSTEDFQYELIRVQGSDEYRFDLGNVFMNVYVTPDTQLFNPRTNHTYRTPTAVEFDFTDTVAYKNGVAIPVGSVLPLMRETLDSLSASIARSLGGVGRAPATLYGHAWTHNQFQDLFGTFGENQRVRRVYISDDWLDLETTNYVPYIFASFRIEEIVDVTENDLFEGGNEWGVRVAAFHKPDGRAPFRVWRKELELSDKDPSGWLTLGGFQIGECEPLETIMVRLAVREIDPISPDDPLQADTVKFALNCGVIIAQSNRTPVYTGWVSRGILPLLDGVVVPNCNGDELILDLCFDGDESLVGQTRIFGFVESTSNSTGAPQFPPLAAIVRWRARVGLGAR